MKRKEAIKLLIQRKDLTGDLCDSLGISGESWLAFKKLPKAEQEQLLNQLIPVYENELKKKRKFIWRIPPF